MIIVPGRSLSVSRRKIVAPRRKQLGYMGFYAAGAMAIFGPGTRIEDSAKRVLEEIRKARG